MSNSIKSLRNPVKLIFFFSICIFHLTLKGQNKITAIFPRPIQTFHNPNIVFNWNECQKKNVNNEYHIKVSTDSNLVNVIYSNVTSAIIDSFQVSNPGRYYWTIFLIEGNDTISFSESFPFVYSSLYTLSNINLLFLTDTGLIVDTSNRIARWTNLADTSRNAIETVDSLKPILVENVSELNFNKVVRFDGLDDRLSILSSVGMAELYTMASWSGPSTFNSLKGLITGRIGGVIFRAQASSTEFGPSQVFPNRIMINNIRTNDFAPLSDYKMLSGNIAGTYSLANGILFGSDFLLTGRFWEGDLAEIIGFSAPINDSIRNIVAAYFCNKYSKPLSLGADILATYGFCDTLVQVDTSFKDYHWSNGDTTSFSSLSPGKTYQLTVTNQFGCEFIDEIAVVTPFENQKNKVICKGDTVVWNTEFNTNTHTFIWSDFSSDSLLRITKPGNYFVIITDTNNCSFSSDTVSIQLDSNLLKTSLGPDTLLCQGNQIALIQPPSDINSYTWSTGSNAPVISIDTAGFYTLKFSDGKCTASDSIQISIQGLAPTADFSAQNFCFNDSVHFLDASTAQPGDVINSWSWDFDDGQSSTNSAPNHLFNSVNDFNVALKVTTDKNCSDTVSKIISIQPLPNTNFVIDNFVSCSKNPIQFLDSTYISAGTISSYFWKFNDSLKVDDTANFANPVYTYDTLGEYTIELVATSNQGCKDTASKTEFINPSPELAYSFSGTCLSDSTYFTDETFLVQGNIENYLWATNGQISLDKNPVFKYLNAGEKPITLRVTTVAGCQETLRDTLRIAENPVADFSSSLACIEDSFKLTNKSTSTDSIVRYNYTFGTNSSSLRNPSFYAPELGVFNIKLTVTTENACKDSIERQLQVEPSPKAAFTILNNRTGVPFDIELTNNSLRSVSYKWEFGNGDFSHDETPNYAYRDTGNYDLKLIVSSQEGCKDSITKQVVALPYFLDALLERIVVEENSLGELLVSAKVLNVGNNTIESLKFSVDLNKQYQIKESFNETIFRGGFLTVSFSGQFIVNQDKKVDFVCVKIEEVNGVEDDLLTNNALCKNGFNKEIVLNAYPNPTSETLILDYVLPQKGELKINVYDQLGRKVLDEISTQAEEGFYQSRLNVINLRPGIYYYKFSLNGEELNGAFVKR